jgi:outer membrane protein TolC
VKTLAQNLKTLLVVCLILVSWNPAIAQDRIWTPEDVLGRVGAYHPGVSAAEIKYRGAEAFVKGAGKQPNPELKLSLSSGTVQEDANSLLQRFEIAGQPALRKKIAQSDQKQAACNTTMARRAVALDSVTAYYRLWLSRRNLEIAAVDQNLKLKLQEISRRRYATGQVSLDESREASVANLAALARLQRAAAGALASEAHFKAILDLSPQEQVLMPGGSTPPVLGALRVPTQDQAAALVEEMPQVEIADAKSRKAELEASLAGKARSPDLYLYAYRGTYNRIADSGVQFGVSFPLFDWGGLGAEHRQKELMAEAYQEEAKSVRRRLKAQLLEELNLYRGQSQYVKILEDQSQERETLVDHRLLAYELGLVTLLEATTAQAGYQSILAELAEATTTLETQRLSLHLLAEDTTSEITEETP